MDRVNDLHCGSHLVTYSAWHYALYQITPSTG